MYKMYIKSLCTYGIYTLYVYVPKKFLSWRRVWRYGQHRARALVVQILVIPRAGRYTCPDQGEQMRVVDQVKDWLRKIEIDLPKTADNNALDLLAAAATGFSI